MSTATDILRRHYINPNPIGKDRPSETGRLAREARILMMTEDEGADEIALELLGEFDHDLADGLGDPHAEHLRDFHVFLGERGNVLSLALRNRGVARAGYDLSRLMACEVLIWIKTTEDGARYVAAYRDRHGILAAG